MSRNLRTRHLPKKTDPESSPVIKKAVKPSRSQKGKEKNETVAKRTSARRDNTNISNELKKSTAEDESKKESSKELPEYGKRSSRLQAKRSKDINEQIESILVKNEAVKCSSGSIRRRTRLKKSNESQENDLGDKKEEHDKKPTQNKFFKTTKPGVNSRRTITQSQRNAAKKAAAKANSKPLKKRESLGYSVPLRQTTLSESFGRGTLRARLRPREYVKDYKDSSSISVLVEKNISPDKRKSIIQLNRIDKPKANREPVYKAVGIIGDEGNDEKESVYDFQFDLNDPGEKTARNKIKRKRPARKQTVTKRKKKPLLLPKTNINAQKKADKPLENDQISSKSIVNGDENTKAAAQIQNTGETEPNEVLEPQIENTGETESNKVLKPHEVPVSHQNPILLDKLEDKGPRARICNVETLTGDRKVSFMPNLSLSRKSSVKFNPFRSTQSIFRPRSTMQARDMMDHSLLNKSLSPIKGDMETFDPASPWRPPLPSSFSSVRRIVQSTPQAKNSFMRTGQGITIDENEENEENLGDKSTPLPKLADKRTVNPLGIRISNAENIQASSHKKNEVFLPQDTNSKPVVTKKPLGLASGFGENRQNSGFGDRLYISPKKSEIGSSGLKRRKNPFDSRGKDAENFTSPNKDAGFKREEKSQSKEELKLLRQANLNTFLNLDEMPESIRINTSHGIFGDENSATLVMKNNQAPKTPVKASIENCFGFDEDCSDVQVSPKKLEKKGPTTVKKLFQRLKGRVLPKEKPVAARISLGEIKNTLYPRREPRVVEKSEKENGGKRDVDVNVETKKDPEKKDNNTQSKNVLDAVQFSDTFDVLSESGQARDDGKSIDNEMALFADLEPVHFTKPPRWSYVKKRDRKQYCTSDQEDEEDEDSRDKPVLKKRKLNKLNKVEEKKIDEWVKSVNETFQEIDDFDLVVEKLSSN